MLCEGAKASCQWFDDPLTFLEDTSCVVSENIPPPPVEGNSTSWRRGCSKGGNFQEARGGFSGAPSKIGKLFKTDS